MADNEFLQKLSQNLLEILDDDEYCDITIEVGNDPYVKIFRAHMNDGTLVQIKLPNISPEIFQIILRYLYGGKLSLEEYDTLDIVKILVAANELSLQELVTRLQSFLITNKMDWMEQNFNLIYQTSFENNSFLELQKYCTNLISEDPDKILESLDFSKIPENLLISIIQCDNLQMDEIQIWDHVLKWGLAQNPGLSSDHSTYSKDDLNSLKNTLQHCIPFIRFYNLTSKEFYDKVLPYKKIFPKELYKDLLATFLNLNPDSKPIDKSKPRMTKKLYSKTKLAIMSDTPDNKFPTRRTTADRHDSSGDDSIQTRRTTADRYDSSGDDSIQTRRTTADKYDSSGDDSIQTRRTTADKYDSSGDDSIQTRRTTADKYDSSGDDSIQTRRTTADRYDSSGDEFQTRRTTADRYDSYEKN
ncbi:uncharacterized protein OCT59_021043 [Rhizophagus irregularis]|uniref:uncharacterized protein n=1 Tax=Rhizophagus irregularis TaxID=588596 RepID=UPI003329C5C7|nr:hypothetical protein OCT59_021043 [Rhizophagus irregularis]